MALATLTDLARREIPNWIPIAVLVAAVVGPSFGLAAPEWPDRALGSVLGIAISFPAFWLGVLGGGDVKLLVAIGAALGFPAFIPFLIATGISGGVLALIARRSPDREIAYAPAMLTGMLGLIPLVLLR